MKTNIDNVINGNIGDKYYALWHDKETLFTFLEVVYDKNNVKGKGQSGRNNMCFEGKDGKQKQFEIPKDTLVKMLDEGMSKNKIAKFFGCSISTVYKTMYQYDIDRKGKNNIKYAKGEVK